jgi:acyl-CoA synthetase (AMP-forming)/AMP-acid ligase II
MCPDLQCYRLGHVGHPRPGAGTTRREGERHDRCHHGGRRRCPAHSAGASHTGSDPPGVRARRCVPVRDKRALIDAATGHELSYAGLADAVREVGAALSARGIRPGDVLALATPNCLEFAVAWFAATSAGAIVTTVNPLCTEEEISRQLRQTGARWLVTTAGLIEQKLNAVVGGTAIEEAFVIGEGAAGTTPFGSLRVAADGLPGLARASDVALLPTSSGTTGLPKSVELTHRNLVASLCQTSLVHRVTEDDVVIAALPLSTSTGCRSR